MYRAPVEEIAFTLKHVAGLGPHLESGRLGGLTEDLADAVLAEAGRFATDEIAPLREIGDSQGSVLSGADVAMPARSAAIVGRPRGHGRPHRRSGAGACRGRRRLSGAAAAGAAPAICVDPRLRGRRYCERAVESRCALLLPGQHLSPRLRAMRYCVCLGSRGGAVPDAPDQCEPQVCNWVAHRTCAPGKNVRDDQASPSAVPGAPECRVERGCRA